MYLWLHKILCFKRATTKVIKEMSLEMNYRILIKGMLFPNMT